jgi:serine/threonine protein kinase
MSAAPQERIGKYQLIKKLGEGATSEVFLAQDSFANRQVAIKAVFQKLLKDPERGHLYRNLFITEASLAGKLTHPHIVQIYDAVQDEDSNYIVMEYVDGVTMEAYCVPDKLLPVSRVVELIFKCTRALDFAHRIGVTHRDIKPANILVPGQYDVKISDFGAAINASAEQTAVIGIGSPAYMSPQQIKEHPLNHQTDIYSLGVVMYQLLTGRLPFQASSNVGMVYQILNTEAAPPRMFRPEIPMSVEAIVLRAMAKDLEQRYQTWEQFSLDLAEAFRNEHLAVSREEFADSEKFNTLRAMPFFGNFTDVELWEVVRFSSWETTTPGQVLMREGESGDFFCMVAAGEVKVTKRRKLLNVLSAGECFGEMAYLSKAGQQRSADVSVMREAKIITIPTQALERASEACRHRFDRAFLEIMVERLSMANARLAMV